MTPITAPPATAATTATPAPPVLHLPIAFDRDRLVVTDPAANRRLRRSRMSPSTAKAMEGCPARYAVERLLPRREDPFGPAPLGTAAHAVMENLMQLPPAQRTRARMEDLLLTGLLRAAPARPADGWPGVDADRAAVWIRLVRTAAAGLFDIEDPAAVTVHATELHLDHVQVAGVPFNGFVDRVDEVLTPSGEPRLRIVDYKTGGKVAWAPPGKANAHDDQIRLYIAAAAQSLQRPESHFNGAVYYTKLGKSKQVPASRRKIRDTVDRFVQAWTDLNECADRATWPCSTSPLCGWCPLVAVCPAAAADGRTARTPGLPTAEQFAPPVGAPVHHPTPTTEPLEPAAPTAGPDAASVATVATVASDAARPAPEPDPGTPRPDPECAAPTAHVQDNGRAAADESRSQTMTQLLREDKAWEETAGPNATLNPNSYAAQAAFGLASMAVQTLHGAGFVLRPSAVDEMAQALGGIVAAVQIELTGRSSMQDGMHARLRGALHTAMQTLPPPLGGTAGDLEAWVESVTRRTRSIASAAIRLWDAGEPAVPEFAALVGLKAA